MPTNLERMIRLADEFFATKSDSSQLSVTEEDREKLQRLHPATLSQQIEGDGPVAWILLIPTTEDLMEGFLTKGINEQELLNLTPQGAKYDAVYLCSALVLPEFRGKGIAKRVASDAIREIQKSHPIRSLFFWEFSPEGGSLADAVARETGLPVLKRPS
ncbi:MAG TPA: GNAT family N-acetyltransferase [Bacteroidota bacterium]|nr:GNAT family N-acetyltransferase [Bacteroidota bacterium]